MTITTAPLDLQRCYLMSLFKNTLLKE